MAKYETVKGKTISCSKKVAEILKKKPDDCPDKIVGEVKITKEIIKDKPDKKDK